MIDTTVEIIIAKFNHRKFSFRSNLTTISVKLKNNQNQIIKMYIKILVQQFWTVLKDHCWLNQNSSNVSNFMEYPNIGRIYLMIGIMFCPWKIEGTLLSSASV